MVSGPMGKGLGIETTGKHVAFVAGTGVLVVADLLAHLLLCLVKPDLLGEKKVDLN
jgi:hypothetical protein